ncbi:MAG TPA: hypothetical protein VGA53_03830 [Candidatus Paceibacterota bacterium]
MIPTPAAAPLLNIVFHGAVFLLVLSTFVVALVVWFRRKKQGIPMGESWKLFVLGLFFYMVSEFSDLFTPSLRASLGMHNYFTEFALLVGLAFIFIAMRRLVVSSPPGQGEMKP